MYFIIAKRVTNQYNVYFSEQMRQRDDEVFSQFGLVVRNLLHFLCRRPTA